MVMKRLALASSAVAGGACLGVWALPKLQKDEVFISYSTVLQYKLFHISLNSLGIK